MLLEHITRTGSCHLDQAGVVSIDQQDAHTRDLLGSRDQLGDAAWRHADEEQPCLAIGKVPAGNEIEMIGTGYRVDRRDLNPGPAEFDGLRIGIHGRLAHRSDQAVEILEQRLAIGIGHRERKGAAEQTLQAGLQRIDRCPVVS